MADREYDIFISHAAEDLKEAQKLRDELYREGWKSFLASENLNEKVGSAEWSAKIDEAIDRSGVVVVIVSPDSRKSPWVEYEWRSVHIDILRGQPGMVIPCCVRGLGPDDLVRALRRYQCIDFRDPSRRLEMFKNLLDLIEGYLKEPIEARKRQTLFRVLSLEGGGVRTLITCRILKFLEEKLRQLSGSNIRLADCFDLIAGISAGGVLALLHAASDLSAAQIAPEFRAHIAASIQEPPFISVLLTGFIHRTPHIKSNLLSVIGKKKLSEIDIPCLVPVFDLISHEPLLLGSHLAKLGVHPDMSIKDVALASVSVPLWFPPYELQMSSGQKAFLIDGCLFAPNPAALALEEAQNFGPVSPLTSEICLLSLSNGSSRRDPGNPLDWKLPRWIIESIEIHMGASADLVDKSLRQLFQRVGFPRQYLRIDADIAAYTDRTFRMDDTTPAALDELERIGDLTAKAHESQLMEFAQLLVSNASDKEKTKKSEIYT
ncbi:MAG: TIR domain-containing protein [Syntrophaceae bacterium]|nr:TIR domain-containing protein [Syntrophaceae bacterium]